MEKDATIVCSKNLATTSEEIIEAIDKFSVKYLKTLGPHKRISTKKALAETIHELLLREHYGTEHKIFTAPDRENEKRWTEFL
jgi:hypothetical protein